MVVVSFPFLLFPLSLRPKNQLLFRFGLLRLLLLLLIFASITCDEDDDDGEDGDDGDDGDAGLLMYLPIGLMAALDLIGLNVLVGCIDSRVCR